jgi:D-sedoheptulose 7-phosphate isomerase
MKSHIAVVRRLLTEAANVKNAMVRNKAGPVEKAAALLIRTLEGGGKIYFCGNGGSAADSQHLATELVGRFQIDRRALPALALTTDTSGLTAIANDWGYDVVFKRQVEALGRPGDALVGISTSGRSRNVILAMEEARKRGLATLAMTGRSKGPMDDLADAIIHIPADRTALVQEGHITVGHILCELIENHFAVRDP